MLITKKTNIENSYCFKVEAKKDNNCYDNIIKTYRIMYNNIFNKQSWLGGYPIIFVHDGSVYCADCAKKFFMDSKEELYMSTDVYYEGPDMYCDECDTVIESAYGDPYAEEIE